MNCKMYDKNEKMRFVISFIVGLVIDFSKLAEVLGENVPTVL